MWEELDRLGVQNLFKGPYVWLAMKFDDVEVAHRLYSLTELYLVLSSKYEILHQTLNKKEPLIASGMLSVADAYCIMSDAWSVINEISQFEMLFKAVSKDSIWRVALDTHGNAAKDALALARRYRNYDSHRVQNARNYSRRRQRWPLRGSLVFRFQDPSRGFFPDGFEELKIHVITIHQNLQERGSPHASLKPIELPMIIRKGVYDVRLQISKNDTYCISNDGALVIKAISNILQDIHDQLRKQMAYSIGSSDQHHLCSTITITLDEKTAQFSQKNRENEPPSKA
jgi:hypothetical protein